MNENIRATMIGFFVFFAVVVLLIFVYLHRAGHQLNEKNTYVAFFDGNLKGLQVGSPVTYRGMRIGEVVDVQMIFERESGLFRIPTYIQFFLRPDHKEKPITRDFFQSLIEKGLRAQLQGYSLLPEMVSIEVNYFPNTPINLHPHEKNYIEIPTVPADENVANVAKVVEAARKTLEGIYEVVSSKETHQTIESLNSAMKEVARLSKNVNENVAPVMVRVDQASRDISSAAYSFRTLTDYLSQHPEAFITGKRGARR